MHTQVYIHIRVDTKWNVHDQFQFRVKNIMYMFCLRTKENACTKLM